MLEGQPNITDPRIAQLLQRLQSTRERWHQRGYEDGIQWAVDLATRDELQGVATHFAELDGRQIAEIFHMQDKHVATHFVSSQNPQMFQRPPEVGVHIASRAAMHGPAMPAVPGVPPPESLNLFYHRAGAPFPGAPDSFHPSKRLQYWQDQDRERKELQGARVEVDESAYLEGWRDAIKSIWQTIAPALS